MLSIDEARDAVLREVPLLETEEETLLCALGRITSEDHCAPRDFPPSDNSAMDGYAFCHAAVSGNALPVTGFLPAGATLSSAVPAGCAVRIMTGAPLPAGCDTVVPIEDVENDGSCIRIPADVKPRTHVRRQGEDLSRGEVVIPRGTLLRPQEIGMLAALGKNSVPVCRRCTVAVLATGDELLEPCPQPPPGKIINSNSYTLAAQVLEAGAKPLLMGIARDTLEETCDRLSAALEADVVVISGGVSVGDRDYVKEAIETLGGKILFWKINIKPGKPLAFALLRGKPVFALPGNPVAASVSFELFVRPSLLKAMGHGDLCRPTVRATLLEEVTNRGERPHLLRGVVSVKEGKYTVASSGNQSSANLSSLVRGNALIPLPGKCALKAGGEVEVLLLGALPHHEAAQ